MMEIDKEEHMQQSKDRALQFLEKNDVAGAWNSMVADLERHPETKGHSGITLGMKLYLMGSIVSVEKMKKFIEGFN